MSILLEHEDGNDLVCRADVCGKLPVHLAAAAGHHHIIQDLAAVVPNCCGQADKEDRWAANVVHVKLSPLIRNPLIRNFLL